MKPLKFVPSLFCILSFLSSRAQAQVTMTIGQNFVGSTYNMETQALPPDCDGTVGPNDFVEFINDQFAVYDKQSGLNTYRIDAGAFWSQAGVSPAAYSDPRIIYDPPSQRWFATMVDLNPNAADPTTQNNNFLLAVSETSDPSGFWKGFRFLASPGQVAFADFPTLGIDSTGVYISGDFFHGSANPPLGAGLVSIPKSDLLLANPTITNRTWFGILDYSVRGQVLQPVFCFDGTSSGNIVATGNIGMDTIEYSNLVCFAVQNANTTNATLTSPVSLTVPPYSVPYNGDFDAPLFTVTQPDGTSQLEGNDARISARVFAVAGVIYAVHNTELNGHMAIRWFRISATTRALLESGTLADNTQDLFYPAIAANASGTVVIGYNACGLGVDQNVGCYAVAGQTSGGVTTFGSPLLLQAGATSYHGDDELIDQFLGEPAYSRWGDYNSMVNDPVDPSHFWAMIMYPSDSANQDVYSTQIIELITSAPLPVLSIAKNGTNATLSWPTSAAAFSLQSNPSIASSLTWSNVTQTPVTNGSTISVVVSATSGTQFFRLKK
jgi:hypothetical protein